MIDAPSIYAKTETEQLAQIKSYLFKMNEQLNYALSNISTANFTEDAKKEIEEMSQASIGKTVESSYTSLKSEIVKTADIVRQEMDVVERELNGRYEAVSSDIGRVESEFNVKITETAENLVKDYHLNEVITSDEFNDYKLATNQYIKTGYLYDAEEEDENGNTVLVPRYGIAVGENLTTVEEDGKEIFHRENMLATFSSNRLSFWQSGNEVAYLSNSQLYITNVVILLSLTFGDFLMEYTSYGLEINWIGEEVDE